LLEAKVTGEKNGWPDGLRANGRDRDDCACACDASPLRSSIMAFGDRSREARESLGWTQLELARRSGLSPSVVSMVESGKRSPTLDTASKIARALGSSLDELVSDWDRELVRDEPSEVE